MDAQSTVIVVGAGQAGVQAAESLRQEKFEGRVVLLGEEGHVPYQRPPLSKKALMVEPPALSLGLRSLESLARRQIELHLDTAVDALDTASGRVLLHNGERLAYDGAILATGAAARPLPIPGAALGGVHALRTLDDAQTIRQHIARCVQEQQPVVVIGGGFIGLEVAASARKLGADVVVLEGLPRLMSRVLAPIVSEAFERLHRAQGVTVVLEAHVSELIGHDGHVTGVRTANGNIYPAGCVIVGVGVLPNDQLARAAGIACDRGIIVDACSRTSDARIMAAGDCTARRLSDGRLMRLESVHNAVEQGKSAAAALLGRERPFVATPWFWSDQYEVKLQMAGMSSGYHMVVIRGDLAAWHFSAFYFRDETLIAVDSLNRAGDHLASRRLLDAGVSPLPEQCADPAFELQSLLRSR